MAKVGHYSAASDTRENPQIQGPLECGLPDEAFRTRAREVYSDFVAGLEQLEELPDGYALRFPGSEAWIDKLLGFIVTERDCCPFFTFELAFEARGGPVWLRLRGEGVKEFLELVHPLASE